MIVIAFLLIPSFTITASVENKNTSCVDNDNIMVIAAVFSSTAHQEYSDPPYNDNPFDAYYVDAAAGAFNKLAGKRQARILGGNKR